jgi:hypothetical protein
MGSSFKVGLPCLPAAARRRVNEYLVETLCALPACGGHAALRSITDVAMQRLSEHNARLCAPVPRVTLVTRAG